MRLLARIIFIVAMSVPFTAFGGEVKYPTEEAGRPLTFPARILEIPLINCDYSQVPPVCAQNFFTKIRYGITDDLEFNVFGLKYRYQNDAEKRVQSALGLTFAESVKTDSYSFVSTKATLERKRQSPDGNYAVRGRLLAYDRFLWGNQFGLPIGPLTSVPIWWTWTRTLDSTEHVYEAGCGIVYSITPKVSVTADVYLQHLVGYRQVVSAQGGNYYVSYNLYAMDNILGVVGLRYGTPTMDIGYEFTVSGVGDYFNSDYTYRNNGKFGGYLVLTARF